MMLLNDNLQPNYMRGDFEFQAINAVTGKIVDDYEEHNMIMKSARTVIARLFAGMNDAKLPDRFVLGTSGHQDGTILVPKTDAQGFINERTSLFSQVMYTLNSGDQINLLKNVYIDYTGSDDTHTGVYYYSGDYTIDVVMSDNVVQGANYEKVDDLPESHTIDFTMAGTETDLENGDPASSSSGGTTSVLISGTQIRFKFEMGTTVGNGSEGVSIYTEAGIFAGDDLFCMKVFPAKIKDETVIFRIFWTITF